MSDLASIAESQIGTQEDSHHRNEGSAILKYQQSTSLDGQGWPWCAAFVDWCVQQAQAAGLVPASLSRPRTASAFGLIDWAREHGLHVFTVSKDEPRRNDIAVYHFSHTGIVSATSRDHFEAIEGNSNTDGSRDGYAVVRHPRPYDPATTFIRFP
jgi:hypothetical protein